MARGLQIERSLASSAPRLPSAEDPFASKARRHPRRVRRSQNPRRGPDRGNDPSYGPLGSSPVAGERDARTLRPRERAGPVESDALGRWRRRLTMVVGIMALRALLERPVTVAEVEREVERGGRVDSAFRLFTQARLERVRRLRFTLPRGHSGWSSPPRSGSSSNGRTTTVSGTGATTAGPCFAPSRNCRFQFPIDCSDTFALRAASATLISLRATEQIRLYLSSRERTGGRAMRTLVHGREPGRNHPCHTS